MSSSTYPATDPPLLAPAGPRRGAAEGALLGFLVAGLAVITGEPILQQLDAASSDVGTLVGPTLVTGALCGRLLGRAAWTSRSSREQALICLGMALLATAIGAYLTGFGLGLSGSSRGTDGTLGVILQAIMAGFVLWPFGLVLFGLVALPITLLAAFVWMAAMRALARGAAVEPRGVAK